MQRLLAPTPAPAQAALHYPRRFIATGSAMTPSVVCRLWPQPSITATGCSRSLGTPLVPTAENAHKSCRTLSNADKGSGSCVCLELRVLAFLMRSRNVSRTWRNMTMTAGRAETRRSRMTYAQAECETCTGSATCGAHYCLLTARSSQFRSRVTNRPSKRQAPAVLIPLRRPAQGVRVATAPTPCATPCSRDNCSGIGPVDVPQSSADRSEMGSEVASCMPDERQRDTRSCPRLDCLEAVVIVPSTSKSVPRAMRVAVDGG